MKLHPHDSKMPIKTKAKIWKDKLKVHKQKLWEIITHSDLSSSIAVCVLVMTFTLVGAGIFIAIEAKNEVNIISHVKWHRNVLCDQIYDEYIAENRSFIISKAEFRRILKAEIVALDNELFHMLQPGAYGNEERRMWTFSGAILFCASLYTTIGFGFMLPRTLIGRIALYMYACLGIPLFFLLLDRIGQRMAIVLEKLQRQLDKAFGGNIFIWLRNKVKHNQVEPEPSHVASRESHEQELSHHFVRHAEEGGGRARAHSINVHMPVLPPIISVPVIEDQSQISGNQSMKKQPEVAMSTLHEFHDHHHEMLSESASRRRYHSAESLGKARQHEEQMQELYHGGGSVIMPAHVHDEFDVRENTHKSEENIVSTFGHSPLRQHGKLPPIRGVTPDIADVTNGFSNPIRNTANNVWENDGDSSDVESENFSNSKDRIMENANLGSTSRAQGSENSTKFEVANPLQDNVPAVPGSEGSLKHQFGTTFGSDEENKSANANTEFATASTFPHVMVTSHASSHRLNPVFNPPTFHTGHSFHHHRRMSMDSDSGHLASEDRTSDQATNNYSRVSVPLAVTMLLVYMCFGCLLFMWLEEWTFSDSFFFVFVSLTTIGLADTEPKNQALFTVSTIYIVFGLALQSMLVSATSFAITRTYQKAAIGVSKASKRVRRSLISIKSYISHTILHHPHSAQHHPAASSESKQTDTSSRQSIHSDHSPRSFTHGHHVHQC